MITVRAPSMLVVLLAIGTLATLLSLAQIWGDVMPDDIFVQSLISLGLAGTAIAFLIAVEFDLPNARSKVLLGAAVFLGVSMVVFIIAQMWFSFVTDGIFIKLMMTQLALLGLVSFGLAAFEDFGSENSLKDEKFIN